LGSRDVISHRRKTEEGKKKGEGGGKGSSCHCQIQYSQKSDIKETASSGDIVACIDGWHRSSKAHLHGAICHK